MVRTGRTVIAHGQYFEIREYPVPVSSTQYYFTTARDGGHLWNRSTQLAKWHPEGDAIGT